MIRAGIILGVASLSGLYAQTQCGPCQIAGDPTLPQGFNPSSITLEVGRDTEVVIQFTLLDAVTFQQQGISLSVYPNYAIYVDSLRMASGTQYVVLRGTTGDPAQYNSSNPEAGALRFDQDHRYKEVRDNTFANMVVYRNPSPQEANAGSGQPSPPRGCVRACVRGVNPTPAEKGDSIYIFLRAFVDPNTIQLGFPPSATDASAKDTTNLKPTIEVPGFGGLRTYADTAFYYGPVYVRGTGGSGSLQKAVQGGVLVSPNPTWGMAMVCFTLSYPGMPVQLRALDMSGRVAYERDMGRLHSGEYRESLSLPPGMYVIELLVGKESHRTRLMVY